MEPAPATANVLDNVVWHALRGPQARLARWGADGRAVRFDPSVSVFTAVDRLDDAAWAAQADLVGPSGVTILFRDCVPPPPAGWHEVFRGPTWQLVAEDVAPTWQLMAQAVAPPGDVAVERLSSADAPEMLALTQLTEPGPYLLRTVELGTYVGVRHDGRLVAMAGERLRPPGCTEISAVCTHPDVRRRGYAAALTAWMTHHIRDRGDTAFLHVLEANENALRLYEAIGFRRRRRVDAVAAIWTGQART